MSYETRNVTLLNDREYIQLKNQRVKLEEQVQAWITKATLLHNKTADQIEKDEIVAVRDSFVAELRSILGV